MSFEVSAESQRVISYTLTLNENAAKRLMSMVRNAVTEPEPREDYAFRLMVWRALESQGCKP